MLTLYHAAPAVCAAKVRLVLAEKNLDYHSRLLDFSRGEHLTQDYLRLNPEGVVPTLVHDGQVLVESTVINEYLDAAFPAVKLRPGDDYGRARSQLWTRREDTIHAVVNTMTTIAVFRPDLLRAPEAVRRARIDGLPNPVRRAKLAKLVDQGLDSPLVVEDLTRLARHLRDMESALTQAPWLGGAVFGLADAGLVSFFYRLEMLQLSPLWEQSSPRIATWLTQCKLRPSFSTAIAAFLPLGVREHYRDAGSAVVAELTRLYKDAAALI
jgi:glutathione S-transferase